MACSAYVQPREQLQLHQVGHHQLGTLKLSIQPLGYEHTAPFLLPALQHLHGDDRACTAQTAKMQIKARLTPGHRSPLPLTLFLLPH